eukprot:1101821-Rhodomonas_salina.1
MSEAVSPAHDLSQSGAWHAQGAGQHFVQLRSREPCAAALRKSELSAMLCATVRERVSSRRCFAQRFAKE